MRRRSSREPFSASESALPSNSTALQWQQTGDDTRQRPISQAGFLPPSVARQVQGYCPSTLTLLPYPAWTLHTRSSAPLWPHGLRACCHVPQRGYRSLRGAR